MRADQASPQPATSLLPSLQVVAPTISSPVCQEQLVEAGKLVAKSVESCVDASQAATEDQQLLKQVGVAATAVTQALNDLLEHIKQHATGGQPVGRYDQATDTILNVTENIFSSMGDAGEPRPWWAWGETSHCGCWGVGSSGSSRPPSHRDTQGAAFDQARAAALQGLPQRGASPAPPQAQQRLCPSAAALSRKRPAAVREEAEGCSTGRAVCGGEISEQHHCTSDAEL